MPFNLGPVELGLILLIVAMLFGVGKLPEVFGSIGKGVLVGIGVSVGVGEGLRVDVGVRDSIVSPSSSVALELFAPVNQ